jgi:hypothetical protein
VGGALGCGAERRAVSSGAWRTCCAPWMGGDQEAKRVLWLGLMCSKMRPAVRYSMQQVCQYPNDKFDVQEEPMDIFTDTIQSTSSCTTMSTRSQQDGQ